MDRGDEKDYGFIFFNNSNKKLEDYKQIYGALFYIEKTYFNINTISQLSIMQYSSIYLILWQPLLLSVGSMG